MSEVAKFDNNAFMKRVGSKVLETFGDMIPEDQFTKLVEAEIREFFETPIEYEVKEVIDEEAAKRSGYGEKPKKTILVNRMSPFRQLVWEAVRQKVIEANKALLTSPNNPIDEFIALIYAQGEFKKGTVSTVQELMVQLSARMMYETADRAGIGIKVALANAMQSVGMPHADVSTLNANLNSRFEQPKEAFVWPAPTPDTE